MNAYGWVVVGCVTAVALLYPRRGSIVVLLLAWLWVLVVLTGA